MNAKMNDESPVLITIPKVETKYSAGYTMHYADPYSSEAWPNPAIAKYFGVESVLGQWR